MKKEKKPQEDIDRNDRIDRALAKMNHKNLQRECVLRGLEPKLIVEWDHHKLSNWFYHNFEAGQDVTRLDAYDVWVEQQLQERGYKKGDAIFSPCFRLGFTPDLDEIKTIKTPGLVEKQIPAIIQSLESKPKRSVDENTGVVSGTKKNLTYTLTKAGKPLEDIISLVKEQFPTAEEKSIKIWYKRCLKALKE